MQTRGRVALRRAYPAAASPHHGLPVASTWRPRAKGTDGVAVRYPQGGGSIRDVGLVMITSSYSAGIPGQGPRPKRPPTGRRGYWRAFWGRYREKTLTLWKLRSWNGGGSHQRTRLRPLAPCSTGKYREIRRFRAQDDQGASAFERKFSCLRTEFPSRLSRDNLRANRVRKPSSRGNAPV
jgi:hypothetical protein